METVQTSAPATIVAPAIPPRRRLHYLVIGSLIAIVISLIGGTSQRAQSDSEEWPDILLPARTTIVIDENVFIAYGQTVSEVEEQLKGTRLTLTRSRGSDQRDSILLRYDTPATTLFRTTPVGASLTATDMIQSVESLDYACDESGCTFTTDFRVPKSGNALLRITMRRKKISVTRTLRLVLNDFGPQKGNVITTFDAILDPNAMELEESMSLMEEETSSSSEELSSDASSTETDEGIDGSESEAVAPDEEENAETSSSEETSSDDSSTSESEATSSSDEELTSSDSASSEESSAEASSEASSSAASSVDAEEGQSESGSPSSTEQTSSSSVDSSVSSEAE